MTDLAYHLDASPRPVLQAAWGWRECVDCGAVFLAPEGRRKCLCCRLGGVESAPPAHWFPDEDDDAGAPLVPEGAPAGVQDDAPEAPQVVERGEDVPGVVPLGIDEERLRAMVAAGRTPADACQEFGVRADQLVKWAQNHHFAWDALPRSPQGRQARALQAEIDGVAPALPVRIPPPDIVPPATDEPPTPLPGPTAVPIDQDWRCCPREGGLWFPVRVEGRRLVVGTPMAGGALTEIEALAVLRHLSANLAAPPEVEVCDEGADEDAGAGEEGER